MRGARWATGSEALATVCSQLHRKPVERSAIGRRAHSGPLARFRQGGGVFGPVRSVARTIARAISCNSDRVNPMQLGGLDPPLPCSSRMAETLPDLIARRIVLLTVPVAVAAVARE